MSILKRFTDIMSANVNALLDKCEDPAKMVDQVLRDLNDDLQKVKAETAAVMAQEKRSKRELDEANSEVEKMLEYAKRAVAAGNDSDARLFLNKKATLAEKAATLQTKYDMVLDNATKMKQMHQKLMTQIGELNERKETIKAKVAMANMQSKMNEATSASYNSGASLSAFDRMEEKANRLLDEAEAMSELNAEPVDEVDALLSKYSNVSSSVEDELAALKGNGISDVSNTSDVDDELAALKTDLLK